VQTTSTRQGRTPSGLAFSIAGEGPALVLIHGLMARGAMFEPLVERLAGDFMLILPDLRGHGASGTMKGPYTVAQSARDVVELLDHVGVPTAALLGYSHGGPVCQQVAFDHPGRVRRLILACSYAWNTATVREYLESWVFSGLISVLGGRRVARLMVREGVPVGGGPSLSARQVSWLREVLGSSPRAALVGAANEMRQFDSRAWLSSIDAETLVVAGADDHAVPEHHLRMLRTKIRHVECQIIEGAGHTLIWTHTAVFAEIVRDWLRRANER
jgi:pimeloyl-ACP methyl ester carboxylesterase